jgi:hypothetical protein
METLFRRPLAAILLLCSALCVGCASDDRGTLQLSSFSNNQVFSQKFSQAYICHSDTGDVDVMLVNDGLDAVRSQDPSKPLTPETIAAPRQYVHIRIFWKPLAHRADHPANTNAAIQWCLLGDGPNQGSLLEYDGSGLVMVDDYGDTATIHIHGAWMKPRVQRGDMIDPLGPSNLEGKVDAIFDSGRVDQLFAEMKSASRIVQVQAPESPGAQPANMSVDP